MYYKICFIIVLIFIIILFFINNKQHYDQYKGIELSPILSSEDIKDLKKGQQIMTNILREFDRICRKNNIKYWCQGGTLLGIIRNKGWIPYDGDIDVGITEEEYKKFKKVVRKELSKEYVFEHKPKGKPCSKIRHLYSHYKYTEKTPNWDVDNGLQLDIFVFKKYKNGYKYPWITMSYEDIFPLKETYFEDIKVYILNNSELYLRTIYGSNYKKLLPVDKRYPHEGRMNPYYPSEKMKIKFKEYYD